MLMQVWKIPFETYHRIDCTRAIPTKRESGLEKTAPPGCRFPPIPPARHVRFYRSQNTKRQPHPSVNLSFHPVVPGSIRPWFGKILALLPIVGLLRVVWREFGVRPTRSFGRFCRWKFSVNSPFWWRVKAFFDDSDSEKYLQCDWLNQACGCCHGSNSSRLAGSKSRVMALRQGPLGVWPCRGRAVHAGGDGMAGFCGTGGCD